MEDVRTVELGQFTDENANVIAGHLEEAGITWWFKQSGRWGRTLFLGDWGTRLFVDVERLAEARVLADRALAAADGDDQGRP